MAQTIKIKCNGAGQHVNDVDLDSALEEAVVYRDAEARLQTLPERVTLRCRVCAEGCLVITRPMLEEMMGAVSPQVKAKSTAERPHSHSNQRGPTRHASVRRG